MQIQRFLTVAELMSFTSAARKLGVEQPVISKTIASLEQTLHLILFIRRREKSSTPAGNIQRSAEGIFPVIEKSVEMAHVLQLGVMARFPSGSIIFTT
jgi:DNA-binding transcriptional LysR family regulator